ncbi:Appr-1-p processing protein [Chitinophaga lutea]|uniref:Appr-1-p processing protein n=1 Tax=Chitinophaga lutea TaxID=2488634 RepID=A0A3N4QPB7_9BACT|nr:macro domain-containing protein [Chitinophaga lutea]RPE13504.1 Appr-1-p processing protein [Chitinophaga lutea]
MSITYVKGDATRPTGTGNKIIVHICNDIGGWGKGFVMAISKRWPQPEAQYRAWYKSGENFTLGKVQFVQVEADTWVANMLGQHKINKDEQGNPPIRYDAVREVLMSVSAFAMEAQASVHMPRIGCGLAGGTWDMMEPVIVEELVERGVEVTVYDF